MLTGMKFALRHAARVLPVSALLGLTLAPAVFAAPPGDIVLGDITVMRLTTPVGNVTAEQRASMVQDRINQAISIPNLAEKDVRMVVEQSGPTIYVRKIKIVTVDPATAESQGVTPIVLAKTWAHRLMGVIAQVCIRVPVAAPAGGGTEIASTPGQPAISASTVATGAAPATAANGGAPTVAATSPPPAAVPNATPAATPAAQAVPSAPAPPTVTPAQPAQPAAPAAPADPPKPEPVTTPTNPTAPATPPTNPPAAPVTPPAPPTGG